MSDQGDTPARAPEDENAATGSTSDSVNETETETTNPPPPADLSAGSPEEAGSAPPLLPPPPGTGTTATGGGQGRSLNKWIVIGAIVAVIVVIGAIGAALGSGGDSGKSDDAASAKPTNTSPTSAPVSTTTTTRPPTTTTTTLPAPILTKEMCTETASEGQFMKDSAALVGTCMHFWANVFQFDSNTGKCSLLAKYGDGPARYNFDYDGGTIRIDGSTGLGDVVQSSAGRVQLPSDSCVQLGPITQGDNIEVWGIVLGVESYTTTMGGSNTYTEIGLVDAYKF
jgi:hypothetical protein